MWLMIISQVKSQLWTKHRGSSLLLQALEAKPGIYAQDLPSQYTASFCVVKALIFFVCRWPTRLSPAAWTSSLGPLLSQDLQSLVLVRQIIRSFSSAIGIPPCFRTFTCSLNHRSFSQPKKSRSNNNQLRYGRPLIRTCSNCPPFWASSSWPTSWPTTER